MTDLATLGLQIDSTQVPKAVGELDKLTAAGARAEGSVKNLKSTTGASSSATAEYAAEVEKLRARIDPLYGSHVKLHSELAQVSKLMGAGAITAAEAGRATAFLSKEAELAGKAVHGVGFASSTATREIMVMMREAGRGDFTRMAGSATILARAIGLVELALTPVGIAVIAVTAAIGALGYATLRAASDTEEQIKAAKDLKTAIDDLYIATVRESQSAWASANASLAAAQGYTAQAVEARKAAIAVLQLQQAKAGAANATANAGGGPAGFGSYETGIAGRAEAEARKTQAKIDELNKQVSEGTQAVRLQTGALAARHIAEEFDKSAAAAGKYSRTMDVLNANLRDGTISEANYEAQVRRAIGVRNASEEASKRGAKAHHAHTKAVREHVAALSDAEKAYIKATEAAQSYLDQLNNETSKIGKTATEIKALEVAAAAAKAPTDALRDAILGAGLAWEVASKMAEAGKASLTDGMDLSLSGLTNVLDPEYLLAGPNALLDSLNAIANQGSVTGQALSDAFGNTGNVIGGLISSITDYSATRQQLAIDVLKGNKTQEQADKQLHSLGVRNTAAALHGIKSLFKEHSTAYKIMSAIEKAYAAFQAAETIASIARDFLKTGTHLANSGVRTTANVTEGGSKIFADLGPWAFPVVAAMIAVMAALGFGGRGGGGASGPSIPTAQDNQDRQGTGSVLGDSKAKSESIAHSLEIVASNTNKDLEYSNGMLRALHSIDNSIAKMAGTVAQQIKVSGSLFDTTGRGLGTTGSGGFLGIGAKSTTRSLFDLGLNLNSASVGSIINGGITGQTYQTVEQIKKKSGFLGIGGSTRTSYQTTNGTIDPAITSAIQDVVTSLRDGLVAGADVIGLTGAKAILDAFQVNIGKISFKDLTGQQIEDQLNAVFSKVGDEMAQALLPSLASMQKVGEGLFETFSRVAREYQVVDVVLQSIGKTFGMVGLASVAARDNLVQLAGGLDEFVSQTNFFRDNFLSAAEQISPTQKAVTEEMRRLGLAGVKTRDQFKNAVLGLNLTTEAGQAMYASLLAVAPAFDKVLNYFDAANKKAASALQSTADKFGGFADSLRKYRESLFGAGSATATYAQLRAKFSATAALAGAGNEAALGGLESSGKAFLDAARDNAATLVDYQRDVALVAQGVDKGIFAADAVADYAKLQLAALTNAVTILGQISVNTAPLAAPAGSRYQSLPSNETSVPVLEAQNATIINQNAAMLEYMRKQSTLWSRFDGDGLLIRTDADTPIRTYV